MKLLLPFLLTFTMLGQQVVTWNPQMDHAYINGLFEYKAASDSVAVRMVAVDSGNYIVDGRFIAAVVVVENHSHVKFDLFPDHFALTLLDAKKSPKVLDYVSPEAVIKTIKHDINSNAFWSGFSSGLATRPQTTTSTTSGNANVAAPAGTANGTYSGTTTTTQRVPDTQAQQAIAQSQAQYQQKGSDSIQLVNELSLRATTLEPGREVRGAVFFKRDRSCGSRSGCQLKLVLPVGDTTFEFPVLMKKP
jgi:hypothetical protein